ncbi:MAG: glycosyltransferase, partial [Eubacteriales bacterium]|nr:glycosyltransferase [Eubacteriales bacterium]
MKRISIIVPCYNEQESVPLFFEACAKAVSSLSLEPEWWFVDDGSDDDTLSVLKTLR